jgi:hypothetical protein
MGAQDQIAECMAPRRGAVIALEVDSTARAYDLKALALGGHTPTEAGTNPVHVMLFMQAETNDVYFYFADGEVGSVATTDVDDIDNTAKVSAGSALAFANTYAPVLKAGNGPLPVRINRAVDRFLVVKAASTAGVLRFWAASTAV